MSGDRSPADKGEPDWPAEVARLNKIIEALIDRSEQSTAQPTSDFDLFRSGVTLEKQVQERTAQLEDALHANERMTRALKNSEAKLSAVVNQSLVAITITQNGKFTFVNPRWCEIFGYSADEARGMGPEDTVVEEDRAMVTRRVESRLQGELDRDHYVFRGRRADGQSIDIEVYGSRVDLDGRSATVSVMTDITERSRAERELRALRDRLRDESTHDALTGLYNRRYIEDVLQRELALAQREAHSVSVVLADLDHFKLVNDTHGHAAGDAVLRAFAALLEERTRGSDVSCRYGGEEFLLVMPRMDQATAIRRAEEVRAAMEETLVQWGSLSLAATASFGVASYPEQGRDFGALVDAADAALYSAKEAGRNRVHGSP